MAKKQRDAEGDDADAGKTGAGVDPLGKLLQRYHVSLAGVLIVSGVVAVIGLGVLAYALLRDPMSLVALLIGTGILLLAVVFLGMNVFNVGQRFEMRKRGVRFVESGIVTELFWDEIADVEVNRTDDTYLGVASVRKRSNNAVGPSGPLTSTEWDVTLRSRDGRKIRLRPAFLRTVPDVKKLISQLRLRAGLP